MKAEDKLIPWIGRAFYLAAFIGLGIFGAYIVLRASGATVKNFDQWSPLLSGLPLDTSDLVAGLGIGMHYVMGTILVLAWPILFSRKIRARRPQLHRWTGRIYVTAGFLAGVGGLSFILARQDGSAAHFAFAVWGSVMMLSAVMAFVHARAKRFDQHRAWAIRLFAMVLGSWIFDLEYRAWEDLTGGAAMGTDLGPGVFDYAILYLFFVPNLLVAEYFIRNQHKRLSRPGSWKWPIVASSMLASAVFVYAIAAVSGTDTGKYGRHLFSVVASWWPGS